MLDMIDDVMYFESLEQILRFLGSGIKRRREMINMSQAQLAALTNLARETISRIEKGKINLSIGNVILILYSLDCSLEIDYKTGLPYLVYVKYKNQYRVPVDNEKQS